MACREKIGLGAVPPHRSAEPKELVAAAVERLTSASHGWLAEGLAMGRPASGNQFVRRWELGAKLRQPIDSIASRVKT